MHLQHHRCIAGNIGMLRTRRPDTRSPADRQIRSRAAHHSKRWQVGVRPCHNNQSCRSVQTPHAHSSSSYMREAEAVRAGAKAFLQQDRCNLLGSTAATPAYPKENQAPSARWRSSACQLSGRSMRNVQSRAEFSKGPCEGWPLSPGRRPVMT